ncbi:hypothetical protein PHAVU_001G189300 [Phaseolus vulgaris]|uniref:AB hydrolase-1 domain-containing protein n=1 Tax=Phaseolus vulgaris TaxID=3885 RepID=V7D038_PHAVU|nr:hypothetical protein PHAVU_001G189300g [Phaseolus vulgaris]ESW34885.1 hypothetical protein PHAVU_001G189300g [Phaseolus vulgaris]
MGSGVNTKFCAASTRAHSWNQNKTTSIHFPSVFAVLFIGLVAWGYQAIQSPPPKLVKIRDGVPKDVAHHKIIFVHGFDACRHHAYVAKTLSPDVAEDLGVYIVSFDRPGYGESDLHPSQTVKSLALDIEELADKLGLGSKFYIIGFSIGGQVRHQGEHESLHRDIILAFGRWEFSPLDLENPFSNKEGWVHSWQGDEDLIVPVKLQGSGHLFPHLDGISDTIVKSLLIAQ